MKTMMGDSRRNVKSDNFQFSIISSVRNCLNETKEFIASLRKFSNLLNYELIVVDDGSDLETKEFLESISNVRLLRNEKSRGFAYSNNKAAVQARGDWIIFMNNDLVLTKNWFVPFAKSITGLLRDCPGVGCVGNIQIDPRTNRIDHAGVMFKEGFPSHFLTGEQRSSIPKKVDFTEYLAVTGACFLIRKNVFLKTGGFDEDYKTGFEDIDLCLRLRMLGYRHFVANKSVIFHKRSSTPQRNEHQEHNSKVFYGRWGKLITRFQEWERMNSFLNPPIKNYKASEDKAHLQKNPENFLFADQSLLEDFFERFLASKKFTEAENLLKVYQANHFGEKETLLLRCRLLRTKGDPEKAKQLIGLAKKKGFGKEPELIMEHARIHQQCGNFGAARRKYFSLFKNSYQKQHCILQIGDCYLAEKKFLEAEDNFTKSILLDPDSFRGWEKLAESQKQLKKIAQEIESLRRALDLLPSGKNVRNRLFDAYLRAGSKIRAYGLLKTFDLKKASGESLLKISRVCLEIGDLNKAVWCLEKLIENEEKLPEANFLLGNAMVFQKRFKDAVRAYRTAINFRNDWPEAISNLSNSKTFLCEWKERDEEKIKLTNYVTKNRVASGAFELAGLYQSEKEILEQAKTKSLILLQNVKPITEKLRFTYKPNDSKKQRIGFLSSDFRNHAVGHLIVGLLQNINREKYEIFLYSTSSDDGSKISKIIQETADEYNDLSAFSLIKKAQKINSDALDLLIDLGGFSRGHNAELLALKPVSRQAHYLGYASTMGKGLIEWTIADKYVIPPSSTKNFGEKIIRMDGCFMPPGNFEDFAKRAKRKNVGLPARGFIYCAFHAAYKIEPAIWACWMRILKAVPESILWLKFKPAEDSYENLKAEAIRAGVSSKRIIMAEDMPGHDTHLSRMAVADLYLDATIYNGHASAMDALRAKLPILTVKGDRFCNRVGESFCKHIGLSEMIARDLKEYESRAIELGLRPSKLLPLRKKIQENADAVLSPSIHARRFELAIDKILSTSKKYKFDSAKEQYRLPKKAEEKSLEDFTLVMVRPRGVSNWAYNVSMLADELKKHGGQTIVIDNQIAKKKGSEFSNSVRILSVSRQSFSDSINHALCEIDTGYLFFLDDPLRILPVSDFIETIESSNSQLSKSKIGILGICSSMEPHTGSLVTKLANPEEKNNRVAGFFTPSFVLNVEAVKRTGGLRKFGGSMALSILDLSLRFEQNRYISNLLEVKSILCPSYSAQDYLAKSLVSAKSQFIKFWGRKPVALKPKYPPKDEQIGETADYQEWVSLCDTITDGDIVAFKKEANELGNKPLISVIMPVFDPPKKFLIKAIESVISQAYENWELCIADDASTKKYIRPLLESYAGKDSRIKITFRKTNGHISVASNSALKLASGEFVAFLDHDDELRPHSLLEVAKVINANPGTKLIYSDEDKIDESGKRYDPYFKPGWNPDLLLGQNYISHLSAFKTSLVKQLKGLRRGYEGAQDWDLILKFSELIDVSCIVHIPKILYHWRAIRGSTALGVREKKNVFRATDMTMSDLKSRSKTNIEYKFIDNGNNWLQWQYRNYEKSCLKVSIIIPTKDRIDLLKKCIKSIRNTVNYNNYEIIIIDNESIDERSKKYFREVKKYNDIKVLYIPGEFNYSKLNNLAVIKAQGEVILLLNNDIEPIHHGWFEEMLSHAVRTEIGCVGAKLLYPNGLLQHGGVIVGISGGAGHAHKFAERNDHGYCGRLSVTSNTTAVTGACMMINKQIYIDAGGLDENAFKVAFNDVDFCLRIEKLGYRNLWTPFAEILHHESATRGDDQRTIERKKRFSREVLILQNRWSLKNFNDRNYNPNLTSNSESFRYGIKKLEKEKSSSLTYGNFADKKIYDSGKAYRKLFHDISDKKGKTESTFITVGGKSKKIGEVSLGILKKFGLKPNDKLVDVGCGYGRLAEALLKNHKGSYIGTDVVPDLLDHAKSNYGGPGWRFEIVDDLVIPVEKESVDMVCFFSIFTHLLHEQSFEYLKNVHESLKIGGRVVFSFLDYRDPTHVPCFESSVSEMNKGHPLNIFMNEELIRAWTKLLGFEVIDIVGPEEKKSLGFPFADFGQSVACLEKVEPIENEDKHNKEKPIPVRQKSSLLEQVCKSLVSGKKQKKNLVLPVLKSSFYSTWKGLYFDCMPVNAEQIHGLIETENISEHEYDCHAIEIIEAVGDKGLVLDCGSGKRPTYYSNVVNFDPVAYETTDVVGVGEELPFKDNSFDAVFSLNVLEHVRDPFTCAKEIIRVLKPHGQLYCVAPLMCPYHGYPDHYYNMTKSGLKNLFQENLKIIKQDVLDSGHPIFSLTWILNSWVEGLNANDRKAFLNKRVKDLLGAPQSYLSESFVKSLNLEKKFEIGATTALWAEKSVDSLTNEQPLFLQLRQKIYNSLSGAGLEIGAFEHPAKLPSSCTVKYFDRFQPNEAKEIFPEINHNCLPKVNFRGDLDKEGLSQIHNETFDFVIINHVLEHLINPIKAIKECFRIIKTGGSVIIAIPDKRYTFDKHRKLTPAKLLHDRFDANISDLTVDNYEEMLEGNPNLKCRKITLEEKLLFLQNALKRREHVNVWNTKSFCSFLSKVFIRLKIEVEIVEEFHGEESKFEYLVHLKKNHTIKNSRTRKSADTVEVLSLHFPKTGGTSFKNCLQEIYGSGFLGYYPVAEEQGKETSNRFDGVSCLHGHLSLDCYAKYFENVNLITWLRNPVDRTISLYKHILKTPDPLNDFHQRVVSEKLSIFEFCDEEENQNQLFRWIGDRNPDDFKFIGFLESAQVSIVRCAATMGWSHVPEFPWLNKAANENYFKISAQEREFIKEKNKEEITWIHRARRIFE